MTLNLFLQQVKSGNAIDFKQTMAIIDDHYHYQPVRFNNGLNENQFINEAGCNEGSCKIFAFALLHQLSLEQTLNLFGDFYRQDVLNNPNGEGHQNIRNFIRDGWEGIYFNHPALTEKSVE